MVQPGSIKPLFGACSSNYGSSLRAGPGGSDTAELRRSAGSALAAAHVAGAAALVLSEQLRLKLRLEEGGG